MATATFGAGCFWGVAAKFRRIPGVLDAMSGYMGGRVENPSYEQVCGGKTGHTEAVQVKYDPERVSYDELLDAFWHMHDPTQRSYPQYKSVIFYHTPEQQMAAEASRDRLQRERKTPIATEFLPAQPFYRAEEYHQRYYEKHGISGDICPQ
jgi:peptide-methionine (S)-S-oxide reductase